MLSFLFFRKMKKKRIRIKFDDFILKVQNWENIKILCNIETYSKLKVFDSQMYINKNNGLSVIKLKNKVFIKPRIKNIYLKTE